MEYHQDRFEDYSLLIFKNEKLIAVLPANITNENVFSHQGLSYGGLIVSKKMRSQDYILAFKQVLEFLKNNSVKWLYIKELPYIYHNNLHAEFDYVVTALRAEVEALNSYYVIDDLQNYKPNRNRKRAITIAENSQITIGNEGLEYFWKDILTVNLETKFQVKPVHTIKEIKQLMQHFPENIKFFSASINSVVKAGVVMFITKNVAHFQYSSGDEERDETGALDYLFHYIIKKYATKKYVSFGSSATDKSLKIDLGLTYWKESFGAKLMPQKTYKISTNSYSNLNQVFK
ncbi:GNAT family N-acetyltransferase [Lacinutrix sp. C3R15]|uniref:GNAT family N-acetyltransferase n=1 Tax=Flavobacteriaceae TaxID=49546 RepID=UPI001C08513D|nr:MULTISPECIES: GNAT family N-acetyltransferase [Flavobacteriaceae]MBU2939661.1 GNAT family N-acetyltransferase [Lacinutrix sp. C3R15]MDO6622976.1 GNAT family N-acetyltransferase [Oceanihabitans sp. 1_MG-2023]